MRDCCTPNPAKMPDVLEPFRQMQPVCRAPMAIQAASKLVEFAAYEMAQSTEARNVARLILMAADLERILEAD